MDDKVDDLQDIIDQLEFDENVLQECPSSTERRFWLHVKNSIILILKENTHATFDESGKLSINDLIYKTIYCAQDRNNIYFFQLKYSSDKTITPRTKKGLVINTISDNGEHSGNLLLHLIVKSAIGDQTDLRNFFAQERNYSVFDLEKRDKQTKFESILLSELDAVKAATKEAGYFVLPQQVIDKLELSPEQASKISDSGDITQSTNISEEDIVFSKEILSQEKYEYFLSKICELKIKEIAFYLTEGKCIKPMADVCISILIFDNDSNNNVTIINASIAFDKSNSLARGICIKKHEENLIDCLMLSRWNQDRSNKTILRFSNRPLEDIVEIHVIFGKISYAILTDKADKKGRGINFWEDLVFKRSVKDIKEQCREFEVDFKNGYKAVSNTEEVNLSEDIKERSRVDTEKNDSQANHVKRIIRNQQANYGTLLYLPTAYGKTFVNLLAIQEHSRLSGSSNPKYLIIGPKSVASVWKKSANQLYEDSDGSIDFELVGFEGDDSLRETKSREQEENHPILFFTSTEKLDADIKNFLMFEMDKSSGKNDIRHNYFDIDNSYYLIIGLLATLKILVRVGKNCILLGCKDTWIEDLNHLKSKSEKIKLFLKSISSKYEKNNEALKFFDGTDKKLEDFREETKLNRARYFEEFSFLNDFQKDYQKLSDDQIEIFTEAIFYYISGAFYLIGKEIDNDLELIRDLSKLGEIRARQLRELNSYREKFSGIILDESDLVLKNADGSRTNRFIFGLAQYCQRRAIRNPQNPKTLLIAASATPWPNDISEFMDHVHFLLPGLTSKYHELLYRFSKSWGKLGKFLEHKQEHVRDRFDKLSTPVRTYFFEWKKLFFQNLVSYVEPGISTSNNYKEKLLLVNCKASLSSVIMKKEKAEIPPVSAFYSRCLSAAIDIDTQLDKDSNMAEMIFQILSSTPGVFTIKKIAFYIDRQEDARNITKLIESKSSEIDPCDISFSYFFADKIDKKASEPQDRLRQLNAFNNMLVIGDLCAYILHMMHSSKSKTESKTDYLAKLLNDHIDSENAKRSDFKTKRKTKSKLQDKDYLKIFFRYAFNENHELYTDVDSRLKNFFLDLNKLVKESSDNIIEDFRKQTTLLWNHISYFFIESTPFEFVNYFDGRVNEKVDTNQKLFLAMVKYTLCYLAKICKSNVLVFGPAGASGIRIDADLLFILSGAWTEGRLSQIKGRVGRKRAKDGSSRFCLIYLPLTDTIFELYILKHYVKKAWLNQFLMATSIRSKDIYDPLLAVRELEKTYKERKDRHFLSPEIHQLAEPGLKMAENYLTYPPLDKAHIIMDLVRTDYTQLRLDMSTTLDTPACSQESIEIPISPEYSRVIMQPNMRSTRHQPETLKMPVENDTMPLVHCSSSMLMDIEPTSREKPKKTSQRKPEIIEIQPILLSVDYKNHLREVINSFDEQTKLFILALPTRGVEPDLTYSQFIQHLSSSIMAQNIKFIVLYGINFEKSTQEENLSLAIKKLKASISEEESLIKTNFSHFYSSYPSIIFFPSTSIDQINFNELKSLARDPNNKNKYFFIPIKVSLSYWAVVIIDVKKETIYYLDPRGPRIPCPEELSHFKTDIRYTQHLGVLNNPYVFSDIVNDDYTSQIFVLYLINQLATLTLITDRRLSLSKHSVENILKICKSKFTEDFTTIKNEVNLFVFQNLLLHIETQGSTENIMLKPLCFGWYADDRKQSVTPPLPPLGRMRQYCLARAQEVYRFIQNEKPQTKIHYISMDGDTGMTPGALTYILKKIDVNDELQIVTAGYNPVHTNFSALMSRISMNINAGLGIPFYGYFSEPLFALSSALTRRIFDNNQNLENYERDEKAIYGFWDMEGRRFLNYCRRLIPGFLNIVGPSKDIDQRPLLFNMKRFLVNTESIPHPISQILPKQLLIEIIQKMCGQSFNSINPYFMGRNISVFLKINVTKVRFLASYFYLKAFVNLLDLGPRRAHNLIRAVYDHHIENKNISEKFNDDDWFLPYLRNINNINEKEMLKDFILRFFIYDLTNPVNKFEKFARLLLHWALEVSSQLMNEFGLEYEGEATQPMLHPESYPAQANKLVIDDSTDYDDEFEEEEEDNEEAQEEFILQGTKRSSEEPRSLTSDDVKAFLDAKFSGWICKPDNKSPLFTYAKKDEKYGRNFLIFSKSTQVNDEDMQMIELFNRPLCIIRVMDDKLEIQEDNKIYKEITEELNSIHPSAKKQKNLDLFPQEMPERKRERSPSDDLYDVNKVLKEYGLFSGSSSQQSSASGEVFIVDKSSTGPHLHARLPTKRRQS